MLFASSINKYNNIIAQEIAFSICNKQIVNKQHLKSSNLNSVKNLTDNEQPVIDCIAAENSKFYRVCARRVFIRRQSGYIN